jgi:hypothetical protein
MNHEDQILALLDEYFRTAPKSEIENDAKFIDGLGAHGISFEEYLRSLSGLNQFFKAPDVIFDDVVCIDDYSKSIRSILMENGNGIVFLKKYIQVGFRDSNFATSKAGESNYAMVA